MHLAFTHLYHAYQGEDPASEHQLALPLKVFLNITNVEGKSADPLKQALADFVTIPFYFLLQVGEYTSSASTKRTRTVQFRRNDVTFWRELPTKQTYRLSPDVEGNGILATQVSNQDTAVLLHYP
jgi:hypothetical protein